MNKTVFYKICTLFRFAFVLIICSWSISGFAQSQELVTINLKNVPIEQVMRELELQTKYVFLNKDADVKQIVSIDVSNKSVSDVLELLFTPRNIIYKIEAKHIVISNRHQELSQSEAIVISGQVLDSSKNPVIGAAVIIKGTTVGTSTDVEGHYTLRVPPPASSAVLSVNYLGYSPVETVVGNRSQIDFTLQEEAQTMDAVVVTALGIKRQEKALSYNVQQVASEDIVGNKDPNFINSLNGKVAGLVINASSSGVGGASKVVMRGTKSIMQSSNALYVIDGVPMLKTAAAGGTEFDSQGSTDPIADINPEDIESMSVLNGAAAAALYGSDAANGAIVITTKKGLAGSTSVTVASTTEISRPFVLPQFQNKYGTGDLNSSEVNKLRSWGRLLNKSNRIGYDPADDYFTTGVTTTNSLSFSTGTGRNQTYVSGASVNSKGIVPNNKYERYNFTFRNTTNFLDERMTLDLGGSYILQKDRNMTNQGVYNNPMLGAYLFPRGTSWNDIKMYERYDESRYLYTQYWDDVVGDGGITMQNPYWINYRNLRETDKNRFMLNASLSYDILDWLSVSGRLRLDNSNTKYTEKFYASTKTQLTEGSRNGLFGLTKTNDKQVYGDVLLNINKTFGNNWSFTANVGASFSDMRYEGFKNRGPIPDGIITKDQEPWMPANVFTVTNISSTSLTEKSEDMWREQTQSVFASAEVGYKGTYYLTLTGRNDWPSALAGPNSTKSSFFYPSVGVSVLLSEAIKMPKQISYLKLRASYAQVGVAFERFIANPRYAYSSRAWNKTKYYPVDLKPELTKSFEVGLTMRFLRHFNLDVSYYNARTQDQTFDPKLSMSGYAGIYLQSGDVCNSGIELAFGYKNKWGEFSWDANYTLSMNRNEILSLGKNVVNPASGEVLNFSHLDMNGLGEAHFLLKEGGSMGDLYSLIDLKRDNSGYIYIDGSGSPATQSIKEVDNYIKLGSVLPDANMALSNSFQWKNFNFGFLITARLGGIVFSRTQAMLDYYGVSKNTADARDRGFVLVNNTDRVDPNKWYSTIGGGTSVPQYYTYDADNVRLQEASIGYNIPRKWLGNVCDITVSLVGRNLWMIYNKAPFDPEAVATTGGFYQGIDYFMMPSMRNVGFNIRIKF